MNQALELDKETIAKAYARWAPVYDLVFGAVFEGAALEGATFEAVAFEAAVLEPFAFAAVCAKAEASYFRAGDAFRRAERSH